MFKRKVEVTPEIKIAVAGVKVEAQQSQFTDMIEAVGEAIQHRIEAVSELESEVLSLQGQLSAKKRKIEEAVNQNIADSAFIDRLKELAGK